MCASDNWFIFVFFVFSVQHREHHRPTKKDIARNITQASVLISMYVNNSITST